MLKLIIVLAIILTGCSYTKGIYKMPKTRDYRQDMRDFVQKISAYTKKHNPSFIIIPQNGIDIITEDGDATGNPVTDYIESIDGVGQESLFYGYEEDNKATPKPERDFILTFLDLAERHGIEVLVTDYCWKHLFVNQSYSKNMQRGYISFAADHRQLDDIPKYPERAYNANRSNISNLAEAKNFLYLLNAGAFKSKETCLQAFQSTDHDILIIDLFFQGRESLTHNEVAALKVKANGSTRLVIAYMSIGEAENYRYYWRRNFKTKPPSWLEEENPDWPGNYKVRYWNTEWQKIIYGNNNSYLKKILDAGFDGVYLDIIDAYEYFESQ